MWSGHVLVLEPNEKKKIVCLLRHCGAARLNELPGYSPLLVLLLWVVEPFSRHCIKYPVFCP